MSDLHERLLPRPRSLRLRDDALESRDLRFAGDQPPNSLVRMALAYLTDRVGILATGAGHAAESVSTSTPTPTISLVRKDLAAEGYELTIDGSGVQIRSGDPRGFFYAAVTLRQWLLLHGWPNRGSIPGVEIRDRPDFARRGILLDISRNKVPSMPTLFRLIDLFSDLKINELQLYMEHTFAYPEHEVVWRDANPLTADQVAELDAYCRLRAIELVPNQNSFGHFHRWLTHEPYRALAESPEGVEHPFSEGVEPFSLCPTDPASLELLRDLYAKLLPSFSSARFHVGFDETFEIGRGRSQAACSEKGLGRVYFDFLRAVRELAAVHGRRIEIWADMLLQHREILAEVPDDVVLCEWGYEVGHPFREDCAVLGTTGCEVYVCPGTSSWSSFAGRTENVLGNLEQAASAGLATGAGGYLTTDWGDHGHLQPLTVSYLGFLAGAAFAWNRSEAKRRDAASWGEAIDRWALNAPGSGLGHAALALGNAYRLTGASQKNGTALFHLLMSPEDGLEHARYREMTTAGLSQTQDMIRATADAIDSVQTNTSESRLAREELLWVADVLSLACDVGAVRLDSPFSKLDELPESIRTRIRSGITELAQRRRELWLERNREGGLDESLARFVRLGKLLGSREVDATLHEAP